MSKVLLGTMATIADDGTETEAPLYGYVVTSTAELEVLFSQLDKQ